MRCAVDYKITFYYIAEIVYVKFTGYPLYPPLRVDNRFRTFRRIVKSFINALQANLLHIFIEKLALASKQLFLLYLKMYEKQK